MLLKKGSQSAIDLLLLSVQKKMKENLSSRVVEHFHKKLYKLLGYEVLSFDYLLFSDFCEFLFIISFEVFMHCPMRNICSNALFWQTFFFKFKFWIVQHLKLVTRCTAANRTPNESIVTRTWLHKSRHTCLFTVLSFHNYDIYTFTFVYLGSYGISLSSLIAFKLSCTF